MPAKTPYLIDVADRTCFGADQLRPRIVVLTLSLLSYVQDGRAGTPSLPHGTLPEAGSAWVSNGAATAARSGNQLTVNQTSNQAILNWKSFNIANDSAVKFVQPSASAEVLNRIGDSSPSVIQGSLQANGRVYLINPNGIVFGNGAQVNVGVLVASSLDVSDETFKSGVLNNTPSSPAFSGDGGAIKVEAGASISTADGGQVWMMAPNIENSGIINTPDGQTLLAAGRTVYLSASDDAAMRGIKVEVGSGGTVTNLGQITAERGNITLAGLAVNQTGRLTATTSVSRNGSIWLQAADAASDTINNAADKTSVALSSGSVTEVLPEVSSTETSTNAQTFLKSQVQVKGHKINLQSGAKIQATSGDVTLDSTSSASDPTSARVYVGAGAQIDVAGLKDVELSMSRNFQQVRLTTNELADSALQKSGALLNKTVTVDIRKGSPLADVSSVAGQIGRTVGERSTTGGTVSLLSAGDVILRENSSLDVSGGSLAYQGGWGRASQLVTADGRQVDIGSASANQVYLGLADQTVVNHKKWGVTETFSSATTHYNPGYLEGKSAGTISITAAATVLDGRILGKSFLGPYQRTSSSAPLGGKLILTQTSDAIDYKAGLEISASVDALDSGFGFSSILPDTWSNSLKLNAPLLMQNGFSRMDFSSAGGIRLDEGVSLDLGTGGSLSLKQGAGYVGNIVLAGKISAPGGSVNVSSAGNRDEGDILLSGSIDVAGNWTNDNPMLPIQHPSSIATNGGSVNLLAARGLDLAAGSSIKVSGGGWYNSQGKLQAEKGGNIVLAASKGKEGSGNNQSDGAMQLGGSLQAYGLTQGGTLSLRADGFALGSAAPAANLDASTSADVALPLSFFSTGGFTSFNLTAWDRGSTLQDPLAPVVSNWVLPKDYAFRPSAVNLADIASLTTLPTVQRQAVSLTLPLSSLTQEAAIITDVGGSVTVNATSHLFIDGLIKALSGNISLNVAGTLPASQNLDDYDKSQSLWLGSNAHLDASGASLITLDKLGHRTGAVMPGAAVNLSTSNSYLVTSPGSVIDVSGAVGTLDIATQGYAGLSYQPTQVASQAGSLSLSSNTGMILGGTVIGHAPSNINQGGIFKVSLLAPDTGNILTTTRQIQLQDSPLDWPIIQFGDKIDSTRWLGRAVVGTASIQAGGFDVANFKSWDQVSWSSDTHLSTGRSISLDTPNVSTASAAALQLASPYVSIGNRDGQRQAAANPESEGSGSLLVHANNIELAGVFSSQGLSKTNLQATGDIRLQGVLDTTIEHNSLNTDSSALAGAYTTAGTISLSAAQIYPTTLSQFTLKSTDSSGISVSAGQGSSGVPLSAGGALSLYAPTIDIGGTVRAPFGTISLNADHDLTLESGAVVSVSAAGTDVPFGYTEGEQAWYYGLDSSLGDTTRLAITAPASKSIALNAESVHLKNGSTVDVSGGGNLIAWEWQKGPGGSSDILAKPGTWAIVPALGSAIAPSDWQNAQTSNLQPGDSIYLSGIAGLPAGNYSLLPAHYALLPGAYAVSLASGMTDMLASRNAVLADGSMLVAGYRTLSSTRIEDARSTGFLLQPGALVRQSSQYIETSANKFFSVDRPVNAGRVSLAARQSMSLDGTVNLSSVDGLRGEVDISAPHIMVTSSRTATPVTAGVLELDADTLSSWQAHRLVIGGLVVGGAGTDGHQTVGVGADTVTIANDSDHPLRAQDVLLTAKDSVILADQSSLQADDSKSNTVPADTLNIGGSGALLHVTGSSQSDVILVEGSSASADGTLQIGAGATVSGPASLHLDATSSISIADTARISAPTLTVSSSLINLGEVPENTLGLSLGTSQLGQLSHSTNTLTLKAYDGINLFGDFSLGQSAPNVTPYLNKLTLNTPVLQSQGGTATFAAQMMTLTNSGSAPSIDATSGSGTLSLFSGADLVIGPGTIVLNGLNSTRLRASSDVIFSGEGAFQDSGDVSVESQRVTATSGAQQSLQASGAITLSTSKGGVDSSQNTKNNGFGAHLSISGSSLNSNGLIDLNAGTLSLNASGDITLGSGAVTRVKGSDVAFYDTTVNVPAGAITLTSQLGNVNVAGDALVDVSGSAQGSDAGVFTVNASNGNFKVDASAQLQGQASHSGHGGAFSLDVSQVDSASVSSLSRMLSVGGFASERSVRARSGDILIGADQTWQANHLSFAADAGKLTVDGQLLAIGPSAGQIDLWAANGLKLDSGAFLQAAGRSTEGGAITLGSSSTTYTTTLADGAHLDVSSADINGAAGSVRIRVARTGITADSSGGTSVALDPILSRIDGASNINIEGVQTYTGINSIGTLTGDGRLSQSQLATDVSQFMSFSPVILDQLGVATQPVFHLTPGVEVQSNGNLALTSDWNLYSANRDGNEAGTLSLRAAGDLLLNNNLSDGFSSTLTSAALLAGTSWSYRLSGGADLTAANPLSVITGAGKVQLAAGKMIRTGTGFIDVASGGDLVFGSGTSALYTAGALAETLPNFTAPNKSVYSAGGGNIDISALGNITGLSASTQDTSNWLYRFGTGPGSSTWWVSFKDFAENIGALGGGKVSLRASGNIQNVSAATASNGRLVSDATEALVQGGGDLKVQAGGSINGGVFAAMNGDAQLSAGDSIGTGSLGLAPLLGLSGDGQLRVQSVGNVMLDGVFNPSLMTPGNKGVQGLNNSYFSTYGADSAVSVLSLSGDTVLNNNTALALNKFRHSLFGQTLSWTANQQQVYAWYPANVTAVALSGNVSANTMMLLPAAHGNLSLLAEDSVTVRGTLTESAFNPQTELASPLRPSPRFNLVAGGISPSSQSLLHSGDTDPVRVYAMNGTVTGPSINLLGNFVEPVAVRAGWDIINTGINAENLAPSDVSLLEAGHDILFTSPLNSTGGLATNNLGVTLSGPGILEVSAGHNLDLGSSVGLISNGNLTNPALPSQGARIVVSAGLGTDESSQLRLPAIKDFITAYLTPENGYRQALVSYMNGLGQGGLTEVQALQAFNFLSPEQQLPFAANVLYAELQASGHAKALSGQSSEYQRGYAAIASLFPAIGSSSGIGSQGDLSLYLSQIKTQRGGDISLLVPGGRVNEGLANPPQSLSKTSSQLGVVTVKGGNVRALVNQDYLVNQSRVFTLAGGDILIWSSHGGIDAGRGAKNTAYAPPPVLITHDDGSVEYDSSASASGSGIGVLLTDASIPPGSVSLIAPRGKVNANEAGIRAQGNLNIAALAVLGVDNISVHGQSVGIPVAVAPPAVTALRTNGEATLAAQNTINAWQTEAERHSDALSTLTVEVVGYGE